MRRHQLQIFGALVLGIIALAYSTIAPVPSATAGPAFAPVTASPLYRFYQDSFDYHFYTADPEERNNLKKQDGWTEYQSMGYVFRQYVPGTVPLYRLTKQELGGSNHFYTIDKSEADNAAQNLGWTSEGVACYVSQTQVAGTVPLYRLYKPLNANGEDAMRSETTLEKVTGAGKRFTSPPYGDGHFYTINSQEKASAMAGGYQFERVEAYVWTQPITVGASPKPPAPATIPESYYTEQLFNLGCSKTPGGGITCPTKQGYFDCEYYRRGGKLKTSECVANFDLASFGKIEANLVDLGCKRFLGRPGEYICESWAGGDACDAEIKTSSGLITKCFSPRTNLVSSYKQSFGREPTAKEVDYWSGEIKAKKMTYQDLMKGHRQWLMSTAGGAERKGVANRSVYEAFGRYATVDEVNTITGMIESNGTSYQELVKGHMDWLLGGGAERLPELSAIIQRAYSAAGMPKPTEAQLQNSITDVSTKRLTFKQLVEKLKHSQFPKGAGKQP